MHKANEMLMLDGPGNGNYYNATVIRADDDGKITELEIQSAEEGDYFAFRDEIYGVVRWPTGELVGMWDKNSWGMEAL
jgi:hypothetical protein